MRIIDAHTHLIANSPQILDFLVAADIKLLGICYVDDLTGKWRAEQAEPYKKLTDEYPERYAWLTSFDVSGFGGQEYAEKSIAALENDLASGAIGCKVWKNIGMEVKEPDGSFLMIDDPVFAPVFAYLEKNGIPLMMHIGEPLECWQPLREGTPHYGYFSEHPQWHMYGKKGFPSHGSLIATRDRVIEKYPELKIIGAHLGSLEYDVRELAKRFDTYPNFMADTSARLTDLMFRDQKIIREFIIKYSDRILFGTDVVQTIPESALRDEIGLFLSELKETYRQHFDYFGTDIVVDKGRSIKGLALPDKILEKIYLKNVTGLFPDL
jgi:predicted TIM-barrel fold metal-dependent hydrolase